MVLTTVQEARAGHHADPSSLQVMGWVRTRRDAKGLSFLEINDGSCLANLQVIIDAGTPAHEEVHRATTGSAVCVEGRLVDSPGSGQAYEMQATGLRILGTAGNEYPLQKKGHSLEFLREIAHLRPRTNLFGAVFRIRSRLSYAIHRFFQERGFHHVHTPIITASDCEGAGEMFRVTTLNLEKPPKNAQGQVDASKDFFGRAAFLTVSGQLEAEVFACALGKVYTFGPTFRAENSNTSRHASEFWMIEPEMAFCDLQGDMELAEAFIKELIQDTLSKSAEDLDFLNRFVDKGLLARLQGIVDRPFKRIAYAEAVDILQKSGETFQYPVIEGGHLQSEHERYLTEKHFQGPVTVHDYPAAIKPFYMRLNDDGKSVAAMDVLVPGIGEIVGGSQREERLDVLEANIRRLGMEPSHYDWYVDLRRFGSVPHSGFGLGFERMLMLVTGVTNIRDVIPFARTPGHAEF